MRSTNRYRGFFWPALLILVGVVALLVNTGQISPDRVIELINLWPLILIVIGLQLIVRRTVHDSTGDIAAALIVLLAVAGAVAYVTIAPNPAAIHTLDASNPTEHLERAAVEVDAGSATVTISSGADLGSDLYHAHIEYSGSKPEVRLDRSTGTLVIDQHSNSVFGLRTGHFVLGLQLNPQIPWTITVNTGASNDIISVPHMHVVGITVNTGASREEITLGPPSGIVPVEVNGGALTVHVHRPSGTEASVAVSGGAVTLDADGKNMHGIGELSYQSPGFAGATDGYRIRVNGGACTVTLDTATESG